MAEAPVGFDPRRFMLVGGVLAVVIFSILFFLFRSCGAVASRNSGYTQVFSNLELRDAANVVARLKELNIPYEIREDGRVIAVQKDKADQARLGLAEKNLPLGGVVGWEIFDESKLGATDFDRRIQLIRAISGELSRTIRRIEGVEDVRVQVVIPETKLFAATTAPVTASVMIRLRPGIQLSSEKINGIIHLVASSVENLQTENVTVVDDFGRILSANAKALPSGVAPAPVPAEVPVMMTQPAPTAEVIMKKAEAAPTSETTVKAQVSTEEKILLRVQAKKELEQDLSGKAQDLLNRFYPINSIIVKVTTELIPTKDIETNAKDLKVKKIYAVILIDNRIEFTTSLKQATFTTAAAAIGYNKKRGDRIIIQRVPFHLAIPTAEATMSQKPAAAPKAGRFGGQFGKTIFWGLVGLVTIIVLWLIISAIRRGRAEEFQEREEMAVPTTAPVAAGRERPASRLDQVKNMAEQNPQAIADLLKRWLSE